MIKNEEDESTAPEAQRQSSAGGQRQTSSYLRELLNSQGLRPRRQLGQNFLIDLNLLELLVKAGTIESGDVVLEIGEGRAA